MSFQDIFTDAPNSYHLYPLAVTLNGAQTMPAANDLITYAFANSQYSGGGSSSFPLSNNTLVNSGGNTYQLQNAYVPLATAPTGIANLQNVTNATSNLQSFISTPTNGNIAAMNGSGQTINSGAAIATTVQNNNSTVPTGAAVETYVASVMPSTFPISNNTAVNSGSNTYQLTSAYVPTATTGDTSNKIANTQFVQNTVASYQTLITSPTSGNIPVMNGSGQTTNSGVSIETTVTNDNTHIPTGAAIETYVTSAVGNYLPKSGGTMTGTLVADAINMNNTNITNASTISSTASTLQLSSGSGQIYFNSELNMLNGTITGVDFIQPSNTLAHENFNITANGSIYLNVGGGNVQLSSAIDLANNQMNNCSEIDNGGGGVSFGDNVNFGNTYKINDLASIDNGSNPLLIGSIVDGQSTYKLQNMVNGTNPQDYVTLSQLTSGSVTVNALSLFGNNTTTTGTGTSLSTPVSQQLLSIIPSGVNITASISSGSLVLGAVVNQTGAAISPSNPVNIIFYDSGTKGYYTKTCTGISSWTIPQAGSSYPNPFGSEATGQDTRDFFVYLIDTSYTSGSNTTGTLTLAASYDGYKSINQTVTNYTSSSTNPTMLYSSAATSNYTVTIAAKITNLEFTYGSATSLLGTVIQQDRRMMAANLNSDWVNYGSFITTATGSVPVTLQAVSANPVYTTSNSSRQARRNGKNLEVRLWMEVASVTSPGTGVYKFLIPGNYNCDSAVQSTAASLSDPSLTVALTDFKCFPIGGGSAYVLQTGNAWGLGVNIVMNDSNTLSYLVANAGSTTSIQPVASGNFQVSAANQSLYSLTAIIPISGWSTN